MKTTTRAASIFISILLCVLFSQAQQRPTPAPQSAVAATNNVQLVIEGKVINVHDGDTITVLDQNNKKFHIRLQGIDAPELKQTFGSESQQNLSRLVLGKQVSIFWTKVDKYRRTVGTIKIEGRDVNIEQVKAGLAWHFKKYEDEQEPQDRITYAAAEQQARAIKLGLWQDGNPTAPGDWRQDVKTKRWGPAPPEGTIIGNRTSKKYHRPDCSGYRDMAEKNRVFFQSVPEAEAAGYKRAGNCPAEIQVAVAKTTSTTPVATVVASPSAPAVVTPPSVPTATTVVPVLSLDARIIGNSNSKKYHRPDCAGYRATGEKNRVYFNSVAEAEAAGYARAGNCPAQERTVKATSSLSGPAATASVTPEAPAPSSPSTPATTPAAATIEAEPKVASPDAQSDGAAAKIIGNKNSKVYHLPGCASYSRVSEKNQVKFDTAADAEKAGYKLAGNCSANKAPKE